MVEKEAGNHEQLEKELSKTELEQEKGEALNPQSENSQIEDSRAGGHSKTRGRAQAVKRILEKVEEKLRGDDVKATLGDYIRLIQLQKELDADQQPTEIKVTWVEPTETSTGNDVKHTEVESSTLKNAELKNEAAKADLTETLVDQIVTELIPLGLIEDGVVD